MKKILAILAILVLITGVAFAATETASVTLKAQVGETASNTGIRVAEGNLSADYSTGAEYDIIFVSAEKDIVISVTEELSVTDAEGYFTVLVKRMSESPIIVSISASAMQKNTEDGHYLGYSIFDVLAAESILSTIADPSTAPSSTITYTASDTLAGGIRDARAFKYTIKSNASIPFGLYFATVSFGITTE